uniref:Ribosomal RNA-processing protein 8 n=1 Tax=Pectinophora gossypiella TaxID=13191 RepID=A0A1E1W912_PECGO
MLSLTKRILKKKIYPEKVTNTNVATKKKKPAKKRKHNDYVRRVINENDIVLNKSELRELDEVIVSAKKLKLQEQYKQDNSEDQLFNEDEVQQKTNIKKIKNKSKQNGEGPKITNGNDSNISELSVKIKDKKKSTENVEKNKDTNGNSLAGKPNKGKHKIINDESDQMDADDIRVKAKKNKFEDEDKVQETVQDNTGNVKKLDYKKKEKFKKILEQNNRNSISIKGDKLRERMMDRLKAAQFRYLNEKLYTSSGNEAQKIFQSDPKAFRTYHQGYQQQVKKWPVNPLDVIIKKILNM